MWQRLVYRAGFQVSPFFRGSNNFSLIRRKFASQHQSYSNYRRPIALGFLGAIFGSSVDYNSVRQDVKELLDDLEHDDGSWGPLFVRLAWHASGTYDKKDGTGGSNGATMRFNQENKDPANAGLNEARKRLDAIKAKYPSVSHSDLWVLASYVAIEEMGGPVIEFSPGRKDKDKETDCPPVGRLPDASKGAQHVRDVFYRMGFNDQEIVALIGGGHSIGRCHPSRSGFDGPWTRSPTTISNSFFTELFDRQWTQRKWNGPVQFQDESGKLTMLPTDLTFKTDPEFRKWSEIYYKDNDRFLKDFGSAFKKLTELGK